MNETDLNTSDSPLLSPALNSLYQTLDYNNKRLFGMIYRHLWGFVAPLKRFINFSGVLYSYWAVDLLRERAGLCSSELSLLSYIYQISDRGRNIIHSDRIYNSAILPQVIESSKQRKLNDLKRRGYLTRSTLDTCAPYLSRAHSRQPVFIRLSGAGIRLIEDMEKDLYKILVNSSFDDLTTGANKKT